MATAEPEQKASSSWKVNTLACNEKQQPAQLPRLFLLHPPMLEPPHITLRGNYCCGSSLPASSTTKGMTKNQVPQSTHGLCHSRQMEEQSGRGDGFVFAIGGSTSDANYCRSATGACNKPEWFVVPEITVVVCKSKPREARTGFIKTSEKRQEAR